MTVLGNFPGKTGLARSAQLLLAIFAAFPAF
jgi:hypothetical protein